MRTSWSILALLLTHQAFGSNDVKTLAAHLEANCFICHGPDVQTAGIDLAALLTEQPLVRNRDAWSRVIGALDVGKMPPPGAAQPTERNRAEMLSVLRRQIDEFDYSGRRAQSWIRAHAPLDARSIRQHVARSLRQRARRHRPFPNGIDRIDRIRKLVQHAVPAIVSDGTLHRGGAARRRARLPGRPQRQRARRGVHIRARRGVGRAGGRSHGARPIHATRLSASAEPAGGGSSAGAIRGGPTRGRRLRSIDQAGASDRAHLAEVLAARRARLPPAPNHSA